MIFSKSGDRIAEEDVDLANRIDQEFRELCLVVTQARSGPRPQRSDEQGSVVIPDVLIPSRLPA